MPRLLLIVVLIPPCSKLLAADQSWRLDSPDSSELHVHGNVSTVTAFIAVNTPSRGVAASNQAEICPPDLGFATR